MTIASQTSRISYTGDGVTTGFPVPFYFSANADLVVNLRDAGGNITLQALGTNYNLSGATLPGGGTCTFVTAPASTYNIVIYRDPALTQTTSYNNNDPFPAKSHEAALDKTVTIDQRTRDLVSRSIRLSDGDATASMTVPALEIRKGKVAGFSPSDGSFAVSNNTMATMDSVLSGALATSGGFNRIVLTATYASLLLVVPFAGAVIYMQGYAANNDGGEGIFVWNASSTATPDGGTIIQPTAGGVGRWLRAIPGGVYSPRMFGAVGDGATNDAAAFSSMLAAVNANTAAAISINLGSGNYALASASLAATPLLFTRSNVTVEGSGASITVTGTTVTTYVFGSAGRSFIRYRNIKFFGNVQANAYANGVAISWTSDNTNGSCSNLTVEGCFFQNFKGDYWIYSESLGTTTTTSDIFIRNNTFQSLTGNARGPGVITIASSFVGVLNINADVNYPTKNVHVTGNTMYADYIKSGVVIFGGLQDFFISENLIWNAGQLECSNDTGCYAILVYASVATSGKTGTVTDNQIYTPRSCGYYQAGPFPGMVISGNYITSQGPDTLDATLPKGGVVLNGALSASVVNNTIFSTARDAIYWTPPAGANASINIANNNIATARYGVHAQAANADTANITIQNNDISNLTAGGILVECFTSSNLSQLTIQANKVYPLSTAVAISVTSPDASYKVTKAYILGNVIDAPTNGVGISFNTFTSASAFIKDNVLTGNFANAIQATNTTRCVIANNSFTGQNTAGYCFSLTGTQGSLFGNTFDNCVSAQLLFNSGGNDLGRIKPTWVVTAGRGEQVQSLFGTEQGSAASKYITTGWYFDTVWLETRTLTGN